jgi:uncharacterized protein
MSLSMYQASVPVFVTMLNNLTTILEKAETLAKERNIEESVLLNWRLTPDMFPFTRQVQIAADFAKGTSARLAGAEAPSYADEEASFADLKRRIAKTIAFVKSFKPGDIDGSEDRERSFCLGWWSLARYRRRCRDLQHCPPPPAMTHRSPQPRQ